ncbi:hypothetical protein RQP46_011161 [Phenoliferia psychrophenolica]
MDRFEAAETGPFENKCEHFSLADDEDRLTAVLRSIPSRHDRGGVKRTHRIEMSYRPLNPYALQPPPFSLTSTRATSSTSSSGTRRTPKAASVRQKAKEHVELEDFESREWSKVLNPDAFDVPILSFVEKGGARVLLDTNVKLSGGAAGQLSAFDDANNLIATSPSPFGKDLLLLVQKGTVQIIGRIEGGSKLRKGKARDSIEVAILLAPSVVILLSRKPTSAWHAKQVLDQLNFFIIILRRRSVPPQELHIGETLGKGQGNGSPWIKQIREAIVEHIPNVKPLSDWLESVIINREYDEDVEFDWEDLSPHDTIYWDLKLDDPFTVLITRRGFRGELQHADTLLLNNSPYESHIVGSGPSSRRVTSFPWCDFAAVVWKLLVSRDDDGVPYYVKGVTVLSSNNGSTWTSKAIESDELDPTVDLFGNVLNWEACFAMAEEEGSGRERAGGDVEMVSRIGPVTGDSDGDGDGLSGDDDDEAQDGGGARRLQHHRLTEEEQELEDAYCRQVRDVFDD